MHALMLMLLAVAVAMGHALLKAPTQADTVYPVGSVFTEKAAPAADGGHDRRLDIANNNINGPNTVVLKPIAVNIYYGAAWTLAQRNLMDFFTSNLGASPYYTTVQTLKDKTGATISPLAYYGSFYDPTPDATVVFGPNALTQIQTIMQAYINAKAIGGTAIDVTTIDFTNTIFNFITSPQVQYSVTGACGYHSVMTLSSNPANPATTNDLKVLYTVNAASLCNPFTGGYSNGQGGNAVILQGAAPNDAAADGVLGTLVHELFATISNPMRDNNGKGTQSWYNNDDVRFSETNTPTYTTKGNYNENSDLCAWSYGLDVTKLYNTRNTNNVATATNGVYYFNANLVVGGRYFLVPQNYVYSPPNSQCAMSAAAIVPLPAAYSTMGLSFVNGINDGNSYYLIVLYYTKATTWQYVWQGPAVAYGKSTQFFKSFPTGTSFAGYRVVRASDNKIVAANIDLATIDNTNSQTVVAWRGALNNIFAGRVGTPGTYTTSNLVVFNAAYTLPLPFIYPSLSAYPTTAVLDATKAAVAAATSSVQTFYQYSATQNQVLSPHSYVTSSYALSPGSNNVLDISGWTFSCGLKGRETLTLIAAAGTTVAAGTTTFVFCFDNAYMQTALFTPATNTVAASAVQLPKMPATGAITTGYLVLTVYGESTCQSAPLLTRYYALGQCTQTGLQRSVIRSATLSNGVYTFVGTDYASSTCDPNTAGPGMLSEGLDTATAVCQANNPQKTKFQTASYMATLPPAVPPQPATGQLARLTYNNTATCSAGTAPLQVDSYAGSKCSNFYGNAYQQVYCNAGGRAWNSTKGGFLIQTFYGSAGCQSMPTNVLVFQLNVCGQWADSGSYKFVAKPLAGSVTAFQSVLYASNDCSGQPLVPSLFGTFHAENIVSQANTTMICRATGLPNPNFAYVTVLKAQVSGSTSGYNFARYNTLAACNAADLSGYFMSRRFYGVGGCFKDAETASNAIAVAGCSVGNTVPTTLTYTYAFQGVSVAAAQSATFTSNCILALAAYWGVPATRVSITSVTPVAGSRRTLLQSSGAVNVNVALVALNMNVTLLNKFLPPAGAVVVNALAPLFLGFSLYNAPVAAPTPSSTSWATPGAIAGVVVGGVVAIVLIVLLSVLIPRMQHYRQAQVFGQGFQPHVQQQQPQQPGAFYGVSSPAQVPQQMEAGVQMGGKVVSF